MKMQTPAVLVYQLSPLSVQGQALRRFLAQRGIRAITVGPEEGGKSLATLLGLQQEAEQGARSLPAEPVLVLYGLVGPTLDELLAFLRGSSPVRLKAAVTPHNLHWSFSRLAAELAREAATLNNTRP